MNRNCTIALPLYTLLAILLHYVAVAHLRRQFITFLQFKMPFKYSLQYEIINPLPHG